MLTMIHINKLHQTRDGRAVRNLRYRDHGRIIEGYVSGSITTWYADGRHDRLGETALDLIRVPEIRMKETAVTADLAKKAMEHNMNVDEQNLLDSARAHVHEAVRICKEHGFMFQALVVEARNEDKLIRMDRKYRTRGLGGPGKIVRLICTDGPGNYPVVGFVHDETDVYRWNAVGGHCHAASREVSAYDLVPVEDAP